MDGPGLGGIPGSFHPFEINAREQSSRPNSDQIMFFFGLLILKEIYHAFSSFMSVKSSAKLKSPKSVAKGAPFP